MEMLIIVMREKVFFLFTLFLLSSLFCFAWSGIIYDAIPLSAVRPTSGSGPIVYDLELLANPLHAMIDRINSRNPDVNSSSSSVEDA